MDSCYVEKFWCTPSFYIECTPTTAVPGRLRQVGESDSGAIRRPHRSYLEMRVAILRAIRFESSPTRIMRRANLSWSRVSLFIPGLVTKGLILETHERGRRTYFLTPNGIEALRLFDAVFDELSEPSDPKVWTNHDAGSDGHSGSLYWD